MPQSIEFLSSGGLGDYFIVMLKLLEWIKKNNHDPKFLDEGIVWTHVESVDIFEAFCTLGKYNPHYFDEWCFQHDPNYVQNIEKYKKGKTIIPTPINGKCGFYNKEWPLENPFLELDMPEKEYDVVLQVSAGVKNDREWLTDPKKIAQALAAMGRHVTLVGTDSRYKERTTDPSKTMNLVGRTNLGDVMDIIQRSNIFIGISGFLTFFSMASKISTIHKQQDEHINKTYLHKKWDPYLFNIKSGDLNSILRKIKEIDEMSNL